MADVGGSIRLFSEMKAFKHDYMINVNDTQGGTQGGTQDKLQGQIFDMIKENPQISTSEIATKLGIGVRTVKRRIE